MRAKPSNKRRECERRTSTPPQDAQLRAVRGAETWCAETLGGGVPFCVTSCVIGTAERTASGGRNSEWRKMGLIGAMSTRAAYEQVTAMCVQAARKLAE